jgi:hypothetical protein
MSYAPLFVIFLALIVILIISACMEEKARRQRLAAYAALENLHFSPARQDDPEDQYPGLVFFQRGNHRYAENFLIGKRGDYALIAFDYHFTTGSGKNRTRHHYAVVILRPPFLLTAMIIRPEGLWDRLTAAFGWDDIDFESAEFSRRFHVSSEDRRWAYDVLTPLTIEFLMGRGTPVIHMNLLHLMIPATGALEPDKIREAVITGAGLLDRIPEFAREAV